MNVLEFANKGPQGPRPEGRLMSKAVGCCHGNESVQMIDPGNKTILFLIDKIFH